MTDIQTQTEKKHRKKKEPINNHKNWSPSDAQPVIIRNGTTYRSMKIQKGYYPLINEKIILLF